MAFPTVNYATRIRGFDSEQKTGGVALAIPRPKYTFLTLFEYSYDQISYGVRDSYRTGKFLAATKSISRPQVSFDVSELRSYNAARNVPTKMTYKPITLTLYDDATGYVAGLLKEYRNHYHYSGEATKPGDFGDGIGTDTRPQSTLPSIGMRVRPTGARNFFRTITIYDLGTEPQSVNVYELVNPVVQDITHSELDYYQGTGMSEVTLQMAYEGYHELVSQDVTNYSHIFAQLGEGVAANIDLSRTGVFKDPDVIDANEAVIVSHLTSRIPGILAEIAAGADPWNSIKTGLIEPTLSSRGVKIILEKALEQARAQDGEEGTLSEQVYSIIRSDGLIPFTNGNRDTPTLSTGEAVKSAKNIMDTFKIGNDFWKDLI